jgi:hypothetical protein
MKYIIPLLLLWTSTAKSQVQLAIENSTEYWVRVVFRDHGERYYTVEPNSRLLYVHMDTVKTQEYVHLAWSKSKADLTSDSCRRSYCSMGNGSRLPIITGTYKVIIQEDSHLWIKWDGIFKSNNP